MGKKVVIAAGGTGGHVYPAIGLANQLQNPNVNVEVLFVGGGLAKNKYFDRQSFAFRTVDCGTFARKSPWECVLSSLNILKGIRQSRKILREFSPDIVVGFGSFYSLPALLAARLHRIPIVLHEQNSVPGKVIRLFSPHAVVTGIHFPETAGYLKGASREVGMPMREGFGLHSCTKDQACAYYGLEPSNTTMLVFGGSQGAKFINRSILEMINSGRMPQLQLLHFTGDPAIAKEVQESCGRMGIKAVVKEFEPCMNMAWRAADLYISRSGAGTISEAIEYEIPGILIPYPFAADNHQDKNADFMVDAVGGACKFREGDLDPEKLARIVRGFLGHEGSMMRTMHEAIVNYKMQSAKTDFCTLVRGVLGG